MAHDITDPGTDGTYPYLPRNPDGTINTELVPIGIERSKQRNVHGVKMELHIMPRLSDGRPITAIAQLPAGQTENDLLPRK
ncbi:hypothetical protein [Cryobacterium tagatosivorans]|uniref:Uncharacterized protein n=1 Tax=Cryobacterium tagatosivorans TaxID=1259199 RepID=A0A4R8UC77_9MICO|nr:hypothetical protein [Cryobacterium tagatosivorans]TFB46505.1 hypothetical protein E3O23_17100 [Cryobacterium tagatosivorans]